MRPADIIQHNFYRLKENLQPDLVLDYLLQQQIFSQAEYDKCTEPANRLGRCQELLVLLKAKGENGYKHFSIILEKTQNHVKKLLDNYAEEKGETGFVYISKDQHEKEVRNCERVIQSLKKQKDVIATRFEEDTKKHHDQQIQHKDEITVLENRLKTEQEKFRNAEKDLTSQMQLEQDRNLAAENSLEEEKKANNALRQWNRDICKRVAKLEKNCDVLPLMDPEQTEHDDDDDNDDDFLDASEARTIQCILMNSKDCDTDQLCLFRCLHAACKPCIGHDRDPIVCKCGHVSPVEELLSDYVRQNELMYSSENLECGYLTTACNDIVVSLCRECNTPLCKRCKDSHARVKANMMHMVIDVSDLKESPVQLLLKRSTCSEHQNEFVVYFDVECQKAICHLCKSNEHSDHPINSLDDEYHKHKQKLYLQLDRHRELVNNVKAHFKERCDLVALLESCQGQVQKKIASVHEDIAKKLRQRFRNLIQNLKDEVQRIRSELKEDVDSLRNTGKSISSTMLYAEKAIEFTTKTEFIELQQTVTTKLEDDTEQGIPYLDERNVQVSFCPKGLKALEELIEEVGEVGLTDTEDAQQDTIPTLKDLQDKHSDLQDALRHLNDVIKIKEKEIFGNKLKIETLEAEVESRKEKFTGLWSQHEESKGRLRDLQDKNSSLQNDSDTLKILLRTKEEEVSKHSEKIKQLEEEAQFREALISDLQKRNDESVLKDEHDKDKGVHNNQENMKDQPGKKKMKSFKKQENDDKVPPAHSQNEEGMTALTVLAKKMEELCRTMSFQEKGVYFFKKDDELRCFVVHCTKLQFDESKVNDNKTHINSAGELVNRKSDTGGRNKRRLQKYRGTSSITPLSKLDSSQYWEVKARSTVDKELCSGKRILEIGICREDEMDKDIYIGGQPHSYSLRLSTCVTHEGTCAKITKEGKKLPCVPCSVFSQQETTANVHFGVLYDEAKRKITFLDVKEGKMMYTIESVETKMPMWPMFGVFSTDYLTTSMTLVVGMEIDMTPKKKALILECLK